MNSLLLSMQKAPLTGPLLVMAAALLFIMMPDQAHAQAINLSPITTFLTSITTALTGPLGKAAATLALIGVAFTFFFGVIDFRQAMWVVVAIVIIGSASVIVNSLWATSATP